MAQTVLSPVDGVYLKEHTSPRREYIFISLDPVFLSDSVTDALCRQRVMAMAEKYSFCAEDKPFHLDGFVFFNFHLNNFSRKNEGSFIWSYLFGGKDSLRGLQAPPSLRFYCDTARIRVRNDGATLYAGFLPVLDQYLRPFYMKSTEVTNGEYKEFVHWVRDSLAHLVLHDAGYKGHTLDENDPGSRRINWKQKIEWNSDDTLYRSALDELMLPMNMRFYKRREIDTRKLLYRCSPSDPSGGKLIVITHVYPDTLCWLQTDYGSWLEPMMNNYFWHPAYDDYPVVGVNPAKIRAFLHWKSAKLQAELDKKDIRYKVQCSLPDEIEWETAVTANDPGSRPNHSSQMFFDHNWICDLLFSGKYRTDTLYPNNNRDTAQIRNHPFYVSLMMNQNGSQAPSRLSPLNLTMNTQWSRFKKDKIRGKVYAMYDNGKGIWFTGGNVSEWMRETYEENYAFIFRTHLQQLQILKHKEAELLASLELYYDSLIRQDSNGFFRHYLVRGSNWLDDRHSCYNGKRFAGNQAKTFVREDKAYPTIGFRYVVHFEPK